MTRLEELYNTLEENKPIMKYEYAEFVNLANKEMGTKLQRVCLNGVLRAHLKLRDYYNLKNK